MPKRWIGGEGCLGLGVSNGMLRVSLGCPRTLLQGCGYGFKPTEMSDKGIVVVLRGSKLSMKTVLLLPRSPFLLYGYFPKKWLVECHWHKKIYSNNQKSSSLSWHEGQTISNLHYGDVTRHPSTSSMGKCSRQKDLEWLVPNTVHWLLCGLQW